MNDVVLENKKHKSEYLLNILGFSFPIFAVMVACALSFLPHRPFIIETPPILLAGSIFVIIPFKKINIVTLQKITAFYLFSIAVNQIAAQYFSFSLFSFNMNISYSVVILLLCAISFIITKIHSKQNTPSQPDQKYGIIPGWIFAFAIIIAHMIFLTLILKKVYGYGFEHNFNVLGNLCLYFLLFLTLWPKLKNQRTRQSFGVVLTIFLLILIIRNF